MKMQFLYGFDTESVLFSHKDKILRAYCDKGSSCIHNEVLDICKKRNLFDLGIVKTEKVDVPSSCNFPLKVHSLLEHEKVPFISYVHEWPAEMIRDACLFHLDLFIKLHKYGLTIKDCNLYNILFRDTRPVFVDFSSVIPLSELYNQQYLQSSSVTFPFNFINNTEAVLLYRMYTTMLEPYGLLPLYLMTNGKHKYARDRLLKAPLNTGNRPLSKGEVLGKYSIRRLHHETKLLLYRIKMAKEPYQLWDLLKHEVEKLHVSPDKSAYSDYYQLKGERYTDMHEFKNKQLLVRQRIIDLKPKTVLDIGANTGWFSVLAAKLGCDVVALDKDESCINSLYNKAQKDRLSILPLFVDILNPTPDISPFCNEQENCKIKMIPGSESLPLILASHKRLKCEMVLFLALVHHVVLGSGLTFAELFKILSTYTEKHLIIEFVPEDDQLIIQEPEFFPSYHSNPHNFGWYTFDTFLDSMKVFFDVLSINDSTPKNRKLIVGERKFLGQGISLSKKVNCKS